MSLPSRRTPKVSGSDASGPGTRIVSSGGRPSLESLGAKLLIVCVVCTQFVDLTLFTIGGFVFSAQKLVVLAILPLALLMIGRLRLPPSLVSFGAIYLMALCAGPVLGQMPAPRIGDHLLTALLSLAAIIALATAISVLAGADRWFGITWALLALASSIVAIAQFAGMLPLFGTSETELVLREAAGTVRATAFKSDPNFLAIVLCAGLGFARIYIRSGPTRFLASALIFLGVLSTLSRIGLILAVCIMLISAIFDGLGRGDAATRVVRMAIICAGTIVTIVLAYTLLPAQLRDYVDSRSSDLLPSIFSAFAGQQSSSIYGSSGAQRSALFQGAIDVALAHPIVGVGGGQLPDYLLQTIGVRNAAHNTFLEFWAVGGLFGILAVVAYTFILGRGIAKLKNMRTTTFRAVILFSVTILISAMTVTLTYNLLFFLPLALTVGLTMHPNRDQPSKPVSAAL